MDHRHDADPRSAEALQEDRQPVERLRNRRLLHRHAVPLGNAPAQAEEHLVHDALHLHLGETVADAEVGAAPERNPATRVFLVLRPWRAEALRIEAFRL